MKRTTPRGTVYEIQGQGPAVVLVHGLGLNRDMWQWLLPVLVGQFRVLTFDLVGHGESADPAGAPDLKMFSEQVADLLNDCALDRCAVVGFSLGGMIARRFAMDYPARLSALAVLNSAHDRSESERAAILERVEMVRRAGPAATVDTALERWFTRDFKSRNPEMMNLVRRWVMANREDVYPAIYRVLAEGDAEIADSVKLIRCPTLVMTGEEDSGNSPAMTRRLAAAIPGAQAVVLPALRHMGLAEDPVAFNAPLVTFLVETLTGQDA